MYKNRLSIPQETIFDKHRLLKLYDEFAAQNVHPRVHIPYKSSIKRGTRIRVYIDLIPQIKLDLKARTITTRRARKPRRPIYSCWRTTEGMQLQELECIKGSAYRLYVPDNAIEGLLVFMIPVKERFKPGVVPSDPPSEILGWVGHYDADYCPPMPDPPADNPFWQYMNLPWFEHYLPFIYQKIRFACTACVIECPHDAIVLSAAGVCSIDPYKCQGQKYSWINQNTARGPEEICWECFNPGDGAESSKCNNVTIRKVLHMNPDPDNLEVPCCAGCDLDMYCPEGAISISGGRYTADKASCTGCMICYYNHPYGYCPWNCGLACANSCSKWDTCTYHVNYTQRMVAHIDPGYVLFLDRIREVAPLRVDRSHYYLGVWADEYREIEISDQMEGAYNLGAIELPFTNSVQMALLDKNKQLLDFQHCGFNLPIRSIGGKRSANGALLGSGLLSFSTRFGEVKLDYRVG